MYRIFSTCVFLTLIGCTAAVFSQQVAPEKPKVTKKAKDSPKKTTPKPTTLVGKVVGVTDGDTLKLLDADNKQHKIRLSGIDCPESKQAFGTKARKALVSAQLTNQ